MEGEQCPAPPLSPLKATRAKLLPAVTENIQGCHAYPLCKGPGARAKLSGGHCAGGGASALTLNLQPLETLHIFVFQSSLSPGDQVTQS